MMYLIIWAVAVTAAIVLYIKQAHSKFSRYGVKGPKVVPLLGSWGGIKVMLKIDHFTDEIDKMYKSFPGERFVGKYELIKPTISLKDLELVKKVTVKDFEHFLDHRVLVDENIESLFARNLFSLKGNEWKDMRSTLSPAFTSSKIRLMVPFMEEVGLQMTKAMTKEINESRSRYIEVDCKDIAARFANDVIATCAFGLKVDSFLEKDNKFFEMGKITTTFKFKQIFIFIISAAFPALAKRFKLQFFAEETKRFFVDLVFDTMKDREVRNITRNDMIHLLMQSKQGNLIHEEKPIKDDKEDAGFATVEESSVGKKNINRVWSDMDLVAQALLFFIAGFESISVAMSFALHELALHPEIQERLVKEIKEHHIRNNSKIDYTSIQHMKYMDMVVSEVLRIWPAAIVLDRVCVKDYNLGKANDVGEDYIVRKGESVHIPVWSIHRDPKYFPDPLKFDPERFSDENKHSIHPVAYMPFGLGPRNCIGSRFALCEMKVFLYMILLNMEVSPTEKTCTSRKLSKDSINLRLEGGHLLRFKLRI